jgi:pectate lyase
VQHTDGSTRHRRLRRAWIFGLSAAVVTAVVGAATAAFGAPLFADNFEDGVVSDWSRSGGSWSVVTDGSRVYRQAGTSSDARALAGQSSWTNYSVQARVKPLAFNGSGRFAGVISRAQSTSRYYFLALRNDGQLVLGKRDGSNITLASAARPVTIGTWYTLRLDASGSSLNGYLNGSHVLSATDSSFASGRIGLATYYSSAAFDDVAADSSVSTPPTTTPPPTTPPPSEPPPTNCNTPPRIIGFASVNAWGQNGTTGGCGGPTVTVTTAAALLDYIGRSGPYIIQVQGIISVPAGMHNVTSNKTIVGVGSNSGITGGGFNIGIPANDAITAPPANAVKNIIIRNMRFTNANDDSINVQMFSHHVWIDHNDLSAGFDGLIDIKRGSSYITVSWNHTHNHTKNMLLGHDDGAGGQDIGRLKVTYHHNWYDQTPQRNPRVRFGEPVHVFNNYFIRNSDVGVACQANSGCIVEGNYFENTEEAYAIDYAGPRGRMVARNNVFVGESFPGTTGGTVQEPSTYYSYTVDDPNSVKASVMAGAGVGRI